MSDVEHYERAVLGACMASVQAVSVADGASLEPADFGDEAHAAIWTDLRAAAHAGRPVSGASIAARIGRSLAALPTFAGMSDPEVGQTLAHFATAVDVKAFPEQVEIVKQEGVRRRVMDRIGDWGTRLQDPSTQPLDILGEIVEAGPKMVPAVANAGGFGMLDLGRMVIRQARTDRAARLADIQTSVITGMAAFDSRTKGIKPGEMMFLGSQPGEGKTAVTQRGWLNFAQSQMKRPELDRIGSLYLSCEMPAIQYGQRIAQMIAQVSGARFRDGTLTPEDELKVINAFKSFKELPARVINPSRLTVSGIRAEIARAVRDFNCGFVVIDHFRRFTLDRRLQNRNDEDEEKVLFLEEMAKTFNIALVVLAHTRKLDGQMMGRRPTLDDLRGSGQIAASADFVTLLHRPHRHRIAAGEIVSDEERTSIEAIWAKDRHGAEGIEKFTFDGETMSVFSM
jgi:replicative DNA helicase